MHSFQYALMGYIGIDFHKIIAQGLLHFFVFGILGLIVNRIEITSFYRHSFSIIRYISNVQLLQERGVTFVSLRKCVAYNITHF